MILDTIILENFGAYGGQQVAILTPEKDKPIILFGGMNGGGKTTLLDAIQLAFYGSRARISNRGKLGYKEYLRESIHRGSALGEGAKIIVRFRRSIEGKTRNFELQRNWREGSKGIEETFRVLLDGQYDDIFTEHWDETIEAYLPCNIAHLFFFDGEQIKELAEGIHTADILGTAIHSLLGLDLVDRLETDLKIFERRKRAEGLDRESLRKLDLIQKELDHLDQEQKKTQEEEGSLNTELGQLEKDLKLKEDTFRKEGGELYLRCKELEEELFNFKDQKKTIESQIRDLVSGHLPLLNVLELLSEIELLARHEREVRRNKILLDELELRDSKILSSLKDEEISEHSINIIEQILTKERQSRDNLANEQLILDADESLAPHLTHLINKFLPTIEQQSKELTLKLAIIDEKIVRLESELGRVPSTDQIADLQNNVEAALHVIKEKKAEIEAVKIRKEALRKQYFESKERLKKFGLNDIDARYAEDDRQRMHKHSQKVRVTLGNFRTKIIEHHASNMEVLMLESFTSLLHKKELVKDLKINPNTFEAMLTSLDNMPLSFERLSAGEKQLLATSLLWGLARASGRPVPTIIDTPLGRLDSSHRRHLIKRYFPYASHQVLLLSTDEEIIGSYYEDLKPYITRSYLLTHNEDTGRTKIEEGYFVQ